MRIAIPSENPGGLDAPISGHFGHCDVFTLVDWEGEVRGLELLVNPGHEHGGCLGPVKLLADAGVTVMIAGGMGPRPLAGFQQAGIEVYFRDEARLVREALDQLAAGQLQRFGEAHTCGGHGGGCGHHEEPVLDVVDEPAHDGLVVRFSYTLREQGQQDVLDAGELRYPLGAGGLLPALEAALSGRRAGEVFTLELAAAQAFGERDDQGMIEVETRRLPAGITVGDSLSVQTPHGVVPMRLVRMEAEISVLDANHPLAGKAVAFEVRVVEIARPRG